LASHTIKTDQFWTHQPLGKGYYGAAWYAIEFDLSDEARRVIRRALREAHPGPGLVAPGGTPLPALHFGAVDGYADIFLDGVKIGEQKKSPGQMWNRPFLTHLPENAFAREGKHRLVVRVEKRSHAAGIWKQVRIVTEAK